jgi:hypothetical protein
MNKIERAIYDTKLRLEDLKRRRMLLIAEINSFEEHLQTLESIERDKSIPHVEILSSEVKEIPCSNVNLQPNGTTILGNSGTNVRELTDFEKRNMYTHIPKNTDISNTK